MSSGTTTAADRAHAHLRGAILRGELAGGAMLSENELAARLSMSRTPVRSALVRLEHEGWVTIYPQRGVLVRTVDQAELEQSAQMRHALESAAVRRATPAHRSAVTNRLAENVHTQERALREGDFDRFVPAALAFHRGFVEMAHNPVMLSAYDQLQARQLVSINQSAAEIVDDPDQVIAAHAALLEAARDGDWVDFADLLDVHQDRTPKPHGTTLGIVV